MAADGSLLFDTKLDDSGVRKGLSKLNSIGTTALKGIGVATAVTTAALTAFGVSAIKAGSEFSAQMSRVQAIAGATGDELKRLNQLAIDLGAETAFSASEAAAGMENLASAGFSVNDIMSAMPGLLDLAAVSGGDVANASEIAASALNAFGLEATEAGHVANVFARAAADTNAEALDMGEAMKYVAPVAKAMGLSLEETAASIGIMSDAGVKGGQAGTALRGALSRLAKPTKIMKETMDELSLSFYDADGNMLPLADTIAMLQDKTAGLTQEQKNNALVTLFGQESLSGMLALIEAGPDKLDALTGSLINSDGAAKDMANTMLNNLQGALEELSGSFETLQITIFQSGETPLKELAEKGTEYINRLTEAFSGKDKMIADMEAIGMTAQDMGFDVEEASGGFEKLAEEAMVIVEEMLNGFIDSLPMIMEAVGTMMSNIGMAIVERIPDLIVMGIDIVMSLATGIVSAFPLILDAGFKAIQALIDGILENLPQIITMAMSLIKTLADGLMENLPMIIQGGMDILLGLLEGITEMLPDLITMAIDLVILIVDNLIDNIDMLVDAGIEIIFALIDGIIENLPKLIEEVPRIINEFSDAIYRQFPKLLEAGIKMLVEIGKGLINAIPTILANAGQIITAIINVFTLANMLSVGKGLITRMGDGIKSMATSMFQWVRGFGTNIINWFKGVLSGNGVLGIGKNLVIGIWNGINSAKDWVLGKIKGFGGAILSGIKGIFGINSPSKVMDEEVGRFLPPGISRGFEKAMPDLQKDVDHELEDLTSEMEYTVNAEAGKMGAVVTSGTSTRLNEETKARAEEGTGDRYVIEVPVVIDGKEVGKTTAEFSSQELEKQKKRRK
jgi:TP901 family phage tail tape measure protein